MNDLLNKSRNECTGKKLSYSSDENMDTSDETLGLNEVVNESLIVDGDRKVVEAPETPPPREKSVDKQADQMIKEAEKARARVYDMPGNMNLINSINVAQIDEDYQMIDAHVDDSFKKKIANFEYVDFSKLIVHHRTIREDESQQRLEIITRNGMTFFEPAADKDALQVSSYSRWEQAFRVYSNILTAKYPNKATELLQYNHTIHTAAMAYVWDNVYAYDREFRQHIAKHPHRPWNVILQQAWTMILKDRLKHDGSTTHTQKHKQPGGRKEICKRFNKGRCSFRCKFEHRCAIPKCGKFGHGAHICRMRDQSQEPAAMTSSSNSSTTSSEGGRK